MFKFVLQTIMGDNLKKLMHTGKVSSVNMVLITLSLYIGIKNYQAINELKLQLTEVASKFEQHIRETTDFSQPDHHGRVTEKNKLQQDNN